MNFTIFLLIAGFVWYVVLSIGGDDAANNRNSMETVEQFESQYTQTASFSLPEEINRFDIHNDKLFISAGNSIYIFDTEGEPESNFPVEPGVRDIEVAGNAIYVLYPASIAVYLPDGQMFHQWDACSDLSDYCSFTVVGDAVFVTDAENKNICKYTTEGYFERFIQSPKGFIIPSYSFDIDSWNDTIYVVNSGRHLVESYTLDGEFIASFGAPGTAAGSFMGCCNPVYISFTPCGTLITSEKGIPRVSNFERNGKFKATWLNNRMLGTGSNAREVRTIDNKLFVAVSNRIALFEL